MQKRYTIECEGKFSTIYSCNSPVGVAIQCCNLKRPIHWTGIPDPAPWASHTIVNDASRTIHVYEHKL
jgi:hypothetical protein